MTIAPTRFEKMPARRFVGLMDHYTMPDVSGIPRQWDAFNAREDEVADALPEGAFGISAHDDGQGGFDYLAGLSVAPDAAVPDGMVALALPAARYAIFETDAHISKIGEMMRAAFGWFNASGQSFGSGAVTEHYGATYERRTGNGGYAIWLPVAAR